MPPRIRLTRDAWLKALASGRLDLRIAFPALGSYGMPGSPWGFDFRTLDAGILYLLVDGGIRVKLPRATWEMTEGTLFMVGPGVRHSLQLLFPDRPITIYHLRLNPRLGRRPCWLREEASLFRHMLSLRPHFEGMLEEAAGGLPWSKERIHAFFFLIFSSLFRFEHGTPQPGLTLSQQARLARYIREHVYDHPTPGQLAATLGLSPAYFARQFKAAYGMIPRVWLLRERLRLASLELAEGGKSITQIAGELGYQDGCLFSRQFTREFGHSPRLFRQRHRQGILK